MRVCGVCVCVCVCVWLQETPRVDKTLNSVWREEYVFSLTPDTLQGNVKVTRVCVYVCTCVSVCVCTCVRHCE